MKKGRRWIIQCKISLQIHHKVNVNFKSKKLPEQLSYWLLSIFVRSMQEPVIPSPMTLFDFGWEIYSILVTLLKLTGKSDSWNFCIWTQWLWACSIVHGSFFDSIQYHGYCSTSNWSIESILLTVIFVFVTHVNLKISLLHLRDFLSF